MNKGQKEISLPLAIELQKVTKENGFELPESEYMWERKMGEWRLIHKDYYKNQKYDPADLRIWIQAYDTSELGEMLPGSLKEEEERIDKRYRKKYKYGDLTIRKEKNNWYVVYEDDKYDDVLVPFTMEENLTEAMGKMLLYLINNKLL